MTDFGQRGSPPPRERRGQKSRAVYLELETLIILGTARTQDIDGILSRFLTHILTILQCPTAAGPILLAFSMKVSILSVGSFALSFLSCSLVHSFPTAENFAKLTHRNGLSSEDIHENLLRLKQKRLFFDPMTTPIDGMCYR
jgi:hypothetical protein